MGSLTWVHVAFVLVVGALFAALVLSGHVDAIGVVLAALVAVIGALLRSPLGAPSAPASVPRENDTRNGAAPPTPPLA